MQLKTRSQAKSLVFIFATSILITHLSACASKAKNDRDPYEVYNRKIFAFNHTLDDYVAKPVAHIYKNTVPNPIRQSIQRAFEHVAEIPKIPQFLAQGKPQKALHTSSRFIINTLFGFVGMVDTAERIGLPALETDTGLTFAHWGARVDSPYFVIPFLGPSTIRDAAGKVFDLALSPIHWIPNEGVQWSLEGVNKLVTRTKYLEYEQFFKTLTVERYILERELYLQYRLGQMKGKSETHAETSDTYIE